MLMSNTEKLLPLDDIGQDDSDLLKIVLGNLLDEKIDRPVSQDSRAVGYNSSEYEKMLLINIETSNANPDTLAKLIPELREVLAQALIFTYNSDLLVLLQEREKPVLSEELKQRITALLDKYDVSACFSDAFGGMFGIKKAYQSNKRILSLHDVYLNQPRLIQYDKFKFADMLLWVTERNKDFDYMQFVSSTIREIHEYDISNGTKLIYTLFCFITSGSSFVLTAKKMFLHKNTVAYRINRVQELFHVDLSSDDSKFELFYSCYILRLFRQV
jgi:sugar diacid utilization regulator